MDRTRTSVGRTALKPRTIGMGEGSWFPSRKDSYGRPTAPFYATHRGRWGLIAVVVTMPKAYRELHPDEAFMIVDRRDDADPDAKPRFSASRAQAKAYAASLVRL